MEKSIHPGKFLKSEYLDKIGLTCTQLANRISVNSASVTRLVSGKGDLSVVMAVKLSGEFETPAYEWLKMQARYSLSEYLGGSKSIPENSVPTDMVKGAIHKTKSFGDVSVIKYISSEDVRVKFVDTGFETNKQAAAVRSGMIKDKLKPNVYGVGFIGDGKYSCLSHRKIYERWRAMMQRCYSKKHDHIIAYQGCTVTKQWHNFQNFAAWFDENYPVDEFEYQLDKDIKINGNKEYSPDACLFVTALENMQAAHARAYSMRTPEGKSIKIVNMEAYCKEHGLSSSGMIQLYLRGKPYKGWASEMFLDEENNKVEIK